MIRAAALVLLVVACAQEAAGPSPAVRYEPSPSAVVDAMLDLAAVVPADVVYELGCGDGRIAIEAARRGARAVCVDIDPRRIAEARANAAAAGMTDRIRFLQQDLLHTDLSEATVVTLFLSEGLNLELRPRLERELPRGARIVSHWHGMGDWAPERTVQVQELFRSRPVFLWRKR